MSDNDLDYKNIAVIGASGAIGSAVIDVLSERYSNANIYGFSKNSSDYPIDYTSEDSIVKLANIASESGGLDLVFVANGMLHDNNIMPAKSLKDLSLENFQRLFEVNTITPALIAKHFIPKLNRRNRSVFAALSARVGSISDNHLGGWYAYRSSKAALNMIIKNTAIEVARRNKKAIIVGLHPGTVDSNLSKPFQANVPDGKLFTAKYSAQKLVDVISSLNSSQTGKCFAWDGSEILP